jgi:NAD(P)-dependent dehydrogenase (short-subunit alcohol dehydrogenase family)
VPTDVTDDAAVQTLVARTVAELGGPHGVNVTVVHPARTLTDVNEDRFDGRDPGKRDRPVRDGRRD